RLRRSLHAVVATRLRRSLHAVVAAGLRDSGAMHVLGTRLLVTPRSERHAQWLVTGPVAGLSSIVNNTPIVALYVPLVRDWAARYGLSASRLLIPLSYAAIAGGSITLLGSATNMVANSALRAAEPDDPGIGFLEPALIGLPLTVSVLVYVILLGRFLPKRSSPTERLKDPRQYAVEMMVEPGGPIVGRKVSQAGLRQLGGLYLSEIVRGEQVIAPVEPEMLLQASDRLIFFGDPAYVSDLLRVSGIAPPSDRWFGADQPNRARHLAEAVLSNRASLIGQKLRQSRFREIYDAAIIAVSRDGTPLSGRIGDVVFQAGDTLLLDAGDGFVGRWSGSREFLLARWLDGAQVPVRQRPTLAIGAVAAMVLGNVIGLWSVLQGAMLAAGAIVLGRCTTLMKARQSIDWSMLMVIGGAIGIGNALSENGILEPVAQWVIDAAGDQPRLVVGAIFLTTALVTTLVSNAAAVALSMPLALAAGHGVGLSAHAVTMTVMIGCTSSFATPMAYQTNLMVMGPGGYRLGDFLRFGLPLVALFGIMTVILIPIIYAS
ncbi:MAG: SLC13 family permease, partial [Panacagrimonas sp.]